MHVMSTFKPRRIAKAQIFRNLDTVGLKVDRTHAQ